MQHPPRGTGGPALRSFRRPPLSTAVPHDSTRAPDFAATREALPVSTPMNAREAAKGCRGVDLRGDRFKHVGGVRPAGSGVPAHHAFGRPRTAPDGAPGRLHTRIRPGPMRPRVTLTCRTRGVPPGAPPYMPGAAGIFSRKSPSRPGSSFHQPCYGMKGSFTQARVMLLNSSGKKRYDSIKYHDK